MSLVPRSNPWMSPAVAPSPPPGASSGSLLVTDVSVKPARPTGRPDLDLDRDRDELVVRRPQDARVAVHETVGADLSIRTTSVCFASALPALSVAKYVSVVAPSAVISPTPGARDRLLGRLRSGQLVGDLLHARARRRSRRASP